MQHPDLLVGFDTSDDACVYRISENEAIVQTVDFFPPVVDDAFTYGQIAAANALSDVYAMGGTPFLAMNLLCIPATLSPEIIREIMAGGYDKVMEAGAVIAGGHTIRDDEPKYGLCVTGRVHPDKIFENKGAMPGDALILTKAIGTGVLTSARKCDVITADDLMPAVESMRMLNKAAAETASHFTVHACTDITGFGLLGHSFEMADASGCTIRLNSGAIPLLPLAKQMAQEGVLPGGAYSNQKFLQDKVQYQDSAPQVLRDLAHDPQTSGGLLLAVPQGEAEGLLAELLPHCPNAAIIGFAEEKGEYALVLE